MNEKVVPADLLQGIRWEPNAPEAVLVVGDGDVAALALRAHFDDADTRCVVLVWHGVTHAEIGSPNDEARHRHRLYNRGVKDLPWVGVVEAGERVRSSQGWQAQMPEDLVHYIVPTKEQTAEVVARSVQVHRLDGSTLQAATEALRH